MESEIVIYFKCTACSECFMQEDIFFAHTRTWHCKVLICEGQNPAEGFGDADSLPVAINRSRSDSAVVKSESDPSDYVPMDSMQTVSAPGPLTSLPVPPDDIAILGGPSGNDIDIKDEQVSDVDALMQKFASETHFQDFAKEDRRLNMIARRGSRGAVTIPSVSHALLSPRFPAVQSRPRVTIRRSTAKGSPPSASKKKRMPTPTTPEGAMGGVGGQRVSGFLCNWCKKYFGTHASLTVHERIHTGVRPYQCAYCPKSFTQKIHCTRHEMSVHGISSS